MKLQADSLLESEHPLHIPGACDIVGPVLLGMMGEHSFVAFRTHSGFPDHDCKIIRATMHIQLARMYGKVMVVSEHVTIPGWLPSLFAVYARADGGPWVKAGAGETLRAASNFARNYVVQPDYDIDDTVNPFDEPCPKGVFTAKQAAP